VSTMMNSRSKRSPLKDMPLRVAGQSLDERIQKVLEEDAYETLVVVGFLVVAAVWEWFRLYYPRPQPVLVTAVAFAGCVGALYKLRRARKRIKALRLARDGERAVAELLDGMRETGYRVFHDLVGPGFNVDHVLVGRHGLFLVETKTISKPATGAATVRYDGESVRVGGFEPERDPVQQASALAKWVGDLVKESTGRACFVRPAILYPGWYVEDHFVGPRPLVWVLNPKQFQPFAEREPERLGAEDVKLISFHLSRYVRSAAPS